MRELKPEVEARERSLFDQRLYDRKDKDKKKPKVPTTVGGFFLGRNVVMSILREDTIQTSVEW